MLGPTLVCSKCGNPLWQVESAGVVRFPNNFRIDPATGRITGNCCCVSSLDGRRTPCNQAFSVEIAVDRAAGMVPM